jgi:hypothetical protein
VDYPGLKTYHHGFLDPKMLRPAWHEICRLPPADQNRFFIAVTNLACAMGLPHAGEIDVDSSLKTIDQWAAGVRDETVRLRHLYERKPGSYQNSEAYFRMMVLVTVLQRDIGIRCSPRSNDTPSAEFFSRPENVFIHGVLLRREGTCSSLPPAFAAVGCRLGYPLKLVKACQHLFLRWDGPTGERFNIECTSQGFVTHPDEYYLKWPEPLSPEQVKRYCVLQSLTPRQELATFAGNRGHVCIEHDVLWEAVYAYIHALDLHPEHWGYSHSLVDAMNRWKGKLHDMMMIGFPSIEIFFPPRGFPNVPLDLERGFCHMMVKEKLLSDSTYREKWWNPLRRDPSNPPPDLPAHIIARFPQKPGETLDFSSSRLDS